MSSGGGSMRLAAARGPARAEPPPPRQQHAERSAGARCQACRPRAARHAPALKAPVRPVVWSLWAWVRKYARQRGCWKAKPSTRNGVPGTHLILSTWLAMPGGGGWWVARELPLLLLVLQET